MKKMLFSNKILKKFLLMLILMINLKQFLTFFEINCDQIDEVNKCPTECKCLISVKQSIKKTNMMDSHLIEDANFKVKTICYKQQIKNLSLTRNISSLTVQLSLQRNFIRRIQKESFQNLEQLYKLNLSFNFIDFIEEGSFKPLFMLKKLDLTSNQIMQIQTWTFSGLFSLSHLYLKKNHIVTLPENSLQNSINSLEFIDLQFNPLRCYCEITWLIRLRDRFKFTEETKCSIPNRLYGMPFNKVSLEEIYCDLMSINDNSKFIENNSQN